jgi:hypothetical protein
LIEQSAILDFTLCDDISRNQIDFRTIFARVDFVNVREDANSMVDEIDPRQPFLRVNILRWREIFRMIETPSSNVDLVGAFVVLIGQRRSTATAKRSPRSCLRPISAGRSFHELELRTFYCDPGSSPAVSTMTIRANTDLGQRAETHLATITATGNFILFHANHHKLGMSNRNRDNLLVAEFRKHCRKSSLTISAKPVGVGAVLQLWTHAGERSLLRTHIAATESVSLSAAK